MTICIDFRPDTIKVIQIFAKRHERTEAQIVIRLVERALMEIMLPQTFKPTEEELEWAKGQIRNAS